MNLVTLPKPISLLIPVKIARGLLYSAVMAAVFYFCVGPNGFINPEKIIFGLSLVAFGFFVMMLAEVVPAINKTSGRLALLFFVDIALVISVMVLLQGAGSKLAFFLLVPLMMSGLLLERRHTQRLALLVSIIYSGALLLQANINIDAVNFTLNQLSFFAVLGFTSAFKMQSEKLEESLLIADEEIGSLKNLNELIVGNISYGIVTTSSHGKILFHNTIAKDLLGADDLIGKPIRFVNHQLGECIERSRLTRKHTGEIKMKSERGELRTIVFGVSPMIEKAIGLRGYLFVLEDVTNLRQMEFQLRQKEKLAAVGQLAAGMAHEIRNPLASISGSIQMLIGDGKTEEEVKLGKIVLKEIDRLNNLIAEFLDFARPPQVGTDELNINALIKEVSELLRLNKHVNHGVEVNVDLQAVQLVIGDKNKYKQALLNIIINAYQAMAKTQKKVLSIRSYDESENVVVEIEDTGLGIPEGELTKIFEAFHTTKVGGTGLGLAITYKILEAHRVEVQVTSEVNVGTKFKLIFPGVPVEFNGRQKDVKMRGIA